MFRSVSRLFAVVACVGTLWPTIAMPADLSTANYERGRKVAELCVTCHGAKGRFADAKTPQIAGQHASYMMRQLLRMREGTWIEKKIVESKPSDRRTMTGVRRKNNHMAEVLIRLSDIDIADISLYFSLQQCRSVASSHENAPRIVTRCQSCHGANGISTNAHVPNLAGQNEAYLTEQLLAFRDAHHGVSWGGASERGGKIMQGQAKLLTDQDISALSAYYASLPCAP